MSEIMTQEQLLESRKHIPPMTFKTKRVNESDKNWGRLADLQLKQEIDKANKGYDYDY